MPFNKLLVNVAGTMGARYLLVSVTVVGTGGEAFKTKMTENERGAPRHGHDDTGQQNAWPIWKNPARAT